MTTLQVLLAYVAAVSALSLALAGLDKRAARRGGRRTPEATLLGLALAGGSPGLVVGLLVFRHKTRKASFLAGLALVLAAQGAAIAWALS